jgi:hypothetical protein
VGCTTTTDPRSRRNRAGRRGGQLLTRARSSWYGSACPRFMLPAPRSPDGRTIRDDPSDPRRAWGTAGIMPVTNAIERLHEEFKRRIKTQCLLPCAETAACCSGHCWPRVRSPCAGSMAGPPSTAHPPTLTSPPDQPHHALGAAPPNFHQLRDTTSPKLRHLYPAWRFDVMTRGGARCVSSARRDLCGGRRAIAVSTATVGFSMIRIYAAHNGCCLEDPGPAVAVSRGVP